MSAIRGAIAEAGLTEADIDYVNAHGTGTAKNDEAEFLSLHTIFDGKNDSLSVSSTKAMTGHCLGAAGAIEAVFAIKALVENTVPPTIGYSDADLTVLAEKAGKLDFCPNVPRRKQLDAVMNNSFAFGGNNASIIFGRQAGEPRRRPDAPDILLTGIGLVTPLGNGKTAYLDACRTGAHMEGAEASSHVTTADYDAQGLKMAFYRKLDHLSQMQAVSGMDALHDAAYTVTDENAGHIGMIIGTSEGAVGPSCDFQNLITQKGNAGGSAFKFPNTVYNAAGGYLSICSGIKGYNVTVTNGNQSGLQSVAYAMQVIRDGRESAMIATGTDENDAILSELYHGLGLAASEPVAPYAGKDTFPLSDGSVSLVLETADSAAARGAVPYCRVRGYGMAHSDAVRHGGRLLRGSGQGSPRGACRCGADRRRYRRHPRLCKRHDRGGLAGNRRSVCRIRPVPRSRPVGEAADGRGTRRLRRAGAGTRCVPAPRRPRRRAGCLPAPRRQDRHDADKRLRRLPPLPAGCVFCSRRLVHGGRDREGSLTGDGRGTAAPGSTYYTQETSHL